MNIYPGNRSHARQLHCIRDISVSLESRYAICDCRTITLDGKPAKISGVFEDSAIVWNTGIDGKNVEFSWETAEKIWKEGGAFKS